MIYVLVGGEIKERNIFLNKNIKKGLTPIFLDVLNKEVILNEALSVSFFENDNFFIIDNIISEGKILFDDEDLKIINDSEKLFVFKEDKITAVNEKKFKKFSKIEFFENKVIKLKKDNTFLIAEYFGFNNKLKTWIIYRSLIDGGIEPEAISGILFWKIKAMLLYGTKFFTKDILKKMSSSLVSIYHEAHRGESDMTISLEKFILSSLNK
ncbi:TPA: hypothetical protein DIC38_00685 [Candidatus Nomurabacteria bacterium]|nr:MAG: hypothetical protein O210_OD1C00001G0591 [Parcubacteria bacterium RAAC4_OD1_1]HCY26187.1 hypothetical protein [Candidatus Nomurabacteria bacterium]